MGFGDMVAWTIVGAGIVGFSLSVILFAIAQVLP